MAHQKALIVIDMQTGVFQSPMIPPVSDAVNLLANVTGLVQKARNGSVPVIFVQHNGPKGHPLEYNTAGWQIHPAFAPFGSDLVIQKSTPDSFHETHLQKELDGRGIRELIIAGIQTEFCIDTTCRRAFSLGYKVILAKNAHGTWDTDQLSAQQIIAHHNNLLNEWFVEAKETRDINFTAG